MNDELAHRLIAAVDKQNKLLEQQLQQLHQREVGVCLSPGLVKKCGSAAKVLAEVHRQMLEEIVEATENPGERLNSFTMHEFVDRYGPRLIQLTSIIQTLEQLGS